MGGRPIGYQIADRSWRRPFRYGHYSPWYDGYGYWGAGAGLIAGTVLATRSPYYGCDHGVAYDEPECIKVRQRVRVGGAWRVRVVAQCS